MTEERTGWVFSREMHALLQKRQVLRDADVVEVNGRQHRVHRHRKVQLDSARSETLCMYENNLCGNREIPRLSAKERTADCNGKSKDVRR